MTSGMRFTMQDAELCTPSVRSMMTAVSRAGRLSGAVSWVIIPLMQYRLTPGGFVPRPYVL
jgi:hypothetical protein